MTAKTAMSTFDCLNEFEKHEILNFDKEIYYVG